MATDYPCDAANASRQQPIPPGFRRVVVFAAAGTMLLAVAGLLGYLPGWSLLGSLSHDYVPMAPSTAVCFLLLASALVCGHRASNRAAGFLPFANVLAPLLVIVFCTLNVIGDMAGIDLTFEDSLTSGMGTLHGFPIGRMSPATGMTFLLAAHGVFMLRLHARFQQSTRRFDYWASTLGVLTLLIGATVLLAYLYGIPLMYTGNTIPMAATTASAFALLSLALIAAAGPAAFPLCLVIGNSTAALLSRTFLPLTMAAVFLQSTLSRFATTHSVINHALALAVLGIGVGIITAVVVTRVSHAIGNQLDALNSSILKAREQHQSIVQTAMDGFWMLDMQGQLIEVNDTYCRMSGYTAEELLALKISDLEVIENQEEIDTHFKKIVELGDDRFESRHRRKDGSLFEVEISAQHHRAGPGGVVVFIRDISERKQAEIALRQQQVMLARTEQVAHIGSWEFDIRTGIVTWSKEMYRLFQWPQTSPPPTLDQHRQLFPAEEWQRVERKIAIAVQTGAPYSFEMRYFHADGEIRYGIVWGFLEKNDKGEAARLVGSFQDITALKQTEAERGRLLTAIEQAGEIIFVTDPEGIIQYANPALAAVTGYSREEVIGQNPRMFKSGQQDEAFYRDMYATITSGRTWHGRMVNKRKDGSLYTEEATLSPVLDDSGKIVSYVAVNRDLTEHLKIENQLMQAQKMESVGRLAGGVAHDYNNMLSVIAGYTELALEQVAENELFREYLHEIRDAANRSTEITRQLLAFARKQAIAPIVMDLNEAVENMLKMLRRLIGEDIELVWRPMTGVCPVRIDPSQVDQVLANLCVNARDAIAGVGRITIETGKATFDASYCIQRPGFIPGDYVVLTVSDDGCGMDRGTVDKIFEPFFTTKDLGQGTGLGLATVYGIVKQNNGFINVYSEPGKGSTFKIYFVRHTDAIVEEAPTKIKEIPVGHGEVVLVVEDEESILKLAQRILEKLGYTPLIADGPSQAFQCLDEFKGAIDLLITDVVMPEMNGKELSNRIRETHPGLKTLFMSGYTANVIAHRGVLDEGVHFMQKPFSKESMAIKIREALGHSAR